MLIVKRAKSDFTGTKRVPFATGINASFSNSFFSENTSKETFGLEYRQINDPKAIQINSCLLFWLSCTD
jgi:hypothetical protein